MDQFTTLKERLAARHKAFDEHLDAAKDARQHEIDLRLAEAETRAKTSRAAFGAKLADGAAHLDAMLAAIKHGIAAQPVAIAGEDGAVERQAGGAEADAAAAELYARCVFDLALACLDEAEVAAIGASYARDRAYVMRHEAIGATPEIEAETLIDRGRPAREGGGKIGALVDQVVGSAKNDLGKVTGSVRLEAEGAAQEARGHVAWAAPKHD